MRIGTQYTLVGDATSFVRGTLIPAGTLVEVTKVAPSTKLVQVIVVPTNGLGTPNGGLPIVISESRLRPVVA